ncbi:SGNH/GDSL hydrolase family protein [Corynebacterium sp. HMSC05C01]|uniref:SGNH/GDSL hydrolase family protein n=1 Tax=Corynebacterium sp. HMSC05C01 TaxID=1581113 RepID=UPI00114D1BBD|nr:SGNH/GDSL hydrolase family protein [Corynebacterium sp. HMSC05C01]
MQYASVGEFMAALGRDGLHSIQIGGEQLDLLLVNRGASATLVTFQHRISERSTYPTFVGNGVSETAGMNLIAVSDPSVIRNIDLRLGWYLGSRGTGPLKQHLLPVIRRSVEYFGGERLVFFGNSGGGYASINYAQHFGGSIALTVNPRLGFADEPNPDLVKYINLAHSPQGRTPYKRVRDQYARNLWDTVEHSAPFYAAMYHNSGDTAYLEANHRRFVDSRSQDLAIFERIQFDGDGHVPIPKSRLIDILDQLKRTDVNASQAIQLAGFSLPKDGVVDPTQENIAGANSPTQGASSTRISVDRSSVKPVRRQIRLKRWPALVERQVTIPEKYTRACDGSLQPGVVTVATDEHGFILTGKRNDSNRRSVIVLGDSVAESLYENTGFRWTDFLSDELDLQFPGEFRVLNGGKSGATLLHIVTSVLNTLPPLADQAALVVIVAPGADAKLERDPATYWSDHKYVAPLEPPSPSVPFETPSIDRDRELLWHLLFETLRAYDVPVALVTAPIRHGAWEKSGYLRNKFESANAYEEQLRRYGRVWDAALSAADKARVPAIAEIENFARLDNESYFYDHVHFNTTGQEAFGANIAKPIADILRGAYF